MLQVFQIKFQGDGDSKATAILWNIKGKQMFMTIDEISNAP